MDLSQLSAPLRHYFLHASTIQKCGISAIAILSIAISWYFFLYTSSTHYLTSKRAHLQQMKQKRAVLEKQLASLKNVTADLACAKKSIETYYVRLPVLNKECAQDSMNALCAKHTLICVKQQLIKDDRSYPAWLGDMQGISYAYRLNGSYAYVADLFEDLLADTHLHACCKKLSMKRSNDHLVTNCILYFIGRKES